MSDLEDRELLAVVGEKANEAIGKELGNHSMDRAYFHFRL